MVLHSKMQLGLCAVLVAVASSAMLRAEPAAPKTQSKVSTPAKLAAAESVMNYGTAKVVPKKSDKPAAVAVAKKDATVAVAKKEKTQDEAATLEGLSKGLQTIHNLRSLFTEKEKNADSPKDGAEKFANGALSEELSKKDSQVWSTIESMLGATQDAMKAVKGKSKDERKEVMKSLEDKLDKKAKDLSTVTDDVNKKQTQQDEEYLLGLLLLHKNDWSMEKQLNATEKFMHNSPVLQNLFKNHDASKPLAPQLAAMMDKSNKAGVAKVEENAAKVAASAAKMAKKETAEIVAKAEAKGAAEAKAALKAEAAAKAAPAPKKNVAKAASAAAKALFIQLADTTMNRDCPYCAAQCVDKCHTAGKPYVQCLTDCADAGKQ